METPPRTATGRLPLLLGLAMLLSVVGGSVAWPRYDAYRHDRTLSRAQTALTAFAAPAGVALDPTGTACGSGVVALCVTSGSAPAELVDALREPLAATGLALDAGCEHRDLEEEALLGITGQCQAGGKRAGVYLLVRAEEGPLLPGSPQPRSSATVEVWESEEAPAARVTLPATSAQAREVLPAGFRLGKELPPGIDESRSRFEAIPPAGMSADAALARLAEHLTSTGFRVDRPCRADRPCRLLLAYRFAGDRSGVEVGAYVEDEKLTLVAGTVG